MKPISDWAKPGFTQGRSRSKKILRLLWQLFQQPTGHHTRPTRAGIVLIAMSMAIGAAAFNTAQNILYLGLALLLGSLIVSGLLSWANFYGCRWRLSVERHGRVGEPLPLVIELANDKSWLPSYGLAVEAKDTSEAFVARAYFGGRLSPGDIQRKECLIHPTKRGRLDLCIASLGSGYPFGFLNKSIRDTAKCSCIIWAPRLSYTLAREFAGRTQRHGASVYRKGSGTELSGMRPYRAGDPPRSIHWKLSARAGRMLVRETLQEASSPVDLIVETVGKQWTAELLDRLAALVSTLAEDLYRQDRLGTVLINGGAAHRIRRLTELHALLTDLALLTPVERLDSGHLDDRALALRFAPSGDGIKVLHGGDIVGGI